MTKQEQQAQLLALLIPACLLGGAYISQYVFGLYPCEMCWWQRWPHFAALAFALASLVMAPKRVLVAIAAGGILTSGLIGVYHAGVEYKLWEGLSACAAPITVGADPLEAILAQPITRCDEAAWTFAGISLAGFNAIISLVSAGLIFSLLTRKNRA